MAQLVLIAIMFLLTSLILFFMKFILFMTSSCAVPYGVDSLNVKRGGFVLVAAADVVGLGGEVLGPAALLLGPDVPGGLHAARRTLGMSYKSNQGKTIQGGGCEQAK